MSRSARRSFGRSFPFRSAFEVVALDADTVFIVDSNDASAGALSVTNDAEAVVAWSIQHFGLC